MAKKLPPEFIDMLAAALQIHIVDRDAFQEAVNTVFVSFFATRLHVIELENAGVVARKIKESN